MASCQQDQRFWSPTEWHVTKGLQSTGHTVTSVVSKDDSDWCGQWIREAGLRAGSWLGSSEVVQGTEDGTTD